MAKTEFTEGIFWRPTLSMQKPKVRKNKTLKTRTKSKSFQMSPNLRVTKNRQVKVLNQFFEHISIIFGILTFLRIVFYIKLKKR